MYPRAIHFAPLGKLPDVESGPVSVSVRRTFSTRPHMDQAVPMLESRSCCSVIEYARGSEVSRNIYTASDDFPTILHFAEAQFCCDIDIRLRMSMAPVSSGPIKCATGIFLAGWEIHISGTRVRLDPVLA